MVRFHNESSVEYVDHMGSDLSVVNSARVSFAKFKNEMDTSDEKLIRYLADHNHWTPFAHAFVSLRLQCPIFVARQLVKHQVGLVWNEESRRYIDNDVEFYIPDQWRRRPDASIKQGSGSDVEPELNEVFINSLEKSCVEALNNYKGLVETYNVAPEMARIILPLNVMTSWVWSGSLMAFARVCNLRLDPHAQKETRDVAEKINTIVAPLFPVSWKALVKHD